VAFEELSGGDTPTIQSQMIANIAMTDFWIGLFGLGPKVTNVTSVSRPSLLSSLKTNSVVWSHSYAYTAGASYG
jgi:hypothetical protein